jgi:hypothetical protein
MTMVLGAQQNLKWYASDWLWHHRGSALLQPLCMPGLWRTCWRAADCGSAPSWIFYRFPAITSPLGAGCPILGWQMVMEANWQMVMEANWVWSDAASSRSQPRKAAGANVNRRPVEVIMAFYVVCNWFGEKSTLRPYAWCRSCNIFSLFVLV